MICHSAKRSTPIACQRWTVAALCAVIVFLGCSSGDGLPRKPVFGAVTSSSTGLEGAISFLPAAGTKGPSSTTAIVEGKYRFAAGDGPVPGKYQVLIVPKVTKQTSQTPADAKSVPTEFRQDATVPAEGSFELNFKVGS